MPRSPTGITYAFGDFELDERLYELRRGGEVVKVEPKIFDVLAYLVRHRERVVSKEELLEKLWPGEFVSDSVLPRCITVARKALGDDASGQRAIQTVHGRGYRFIAPLSGRGAGPARAGSRAAATVPNGGEGDASLPEPAALFVGREEAMRELEMALAQAVDGHGRLVLLVGEPGIGKTRTAEELARRAAGRAAVHTGRCYEGEGAPAFWPWVQVLRSCLGDADPARVLADLGDTAGAAMQLVPELADQLPGTRSAPGDSAEQTRFRLFESVTTFLTRSARSEPLVLVLDDLHWADKSSLLLLQFLAREMRDARILVVGTYRDVGLTRHHPLAQLLGDLARERLHQRVLLRGLGEADVARFVETAGGRSPARSVVAAIYEMTEGNPFFIGEIVRLLLADAGRDRLADDAPLAMPLPQGVREAIGRRLSALSADCNTVLTIASVIGREFGVTVLERVSRTPGDRLLEVLEDAVSARILHPVAATPGRYGFAHTLVRETLYEELSTVQRVRLHRQVGSVLEEIHRANPGPYLAEMAHHFFQGAPGGDVEKAIAFALQAGERALQLLAYDEAADHYERALQAIELAAPVDDVRLCDVLLRLGDAHSRAGEREKARPTFMRAAEAARRNGRADQLAMAALGFGGRAEFGMPKDPALIALLEEGVAALGDRDDTLRSRLLSRLTGTAPYSESMEMRQSFSLEAVELARRTGDPEALVVALGARCWALLGPDHVPERLALGTELVTVAERTRSKSAAFMGHEYRTTALLALGDIAGVDREIETLAAIARELRQPLELWFVTWFRACRALGDGRFEDAGRLIEEARELGRRAQHPGTALVENGLALFLAHEHGRSEEFADRFELFTEHYPWAERLLHLSSALSLTELGREEDARAAFELVAAHDFRDIQRDEHWMVIMVQLAAICTDLNDTRRAAVLYELLAPFRDRVAVHDLLRVYSGCVAHYLGLLAAALGRFDLAVEHLEEACDTHLRMGARPFVVRSQYEHARVLLARGRRQDAVKAQRLLRDAAEAARVMGMERARDLAVRLAARSGAEPAPLRRTSRK